MTGLYIHIPFCVKKCRYCDFVSYPLSALEKMTGDAATRPFASQVSMVEAYGRALAAEAEMASSLLSRPMIDTVFIGGGTPSVTGGGFISALMAHMRKSFDIKPNAEITVEANPGTVDEEKLTEYIRAGVNRLSLGLQSTNDALLKRIGRVHTFEDFRSAVKDAKRAGFKNINVDLMQGLPGQTIEDCIKDVSIVADEGVTHISAYSLILEEKTPLFFDVKGGRENLPDDDETADMQDAAEERLEKLGFMKYEVSNYARKGYECRHNLNYWENGEYIGIGAAAHSCISVGGERIRKANMTALDKYIEACANGVLPETERKVISRDEEMFETIMLGLRTVRGIDMKAFKKRFSCDISDRYNMEIARLTDKELIEISGGFLRTTRRGAELLNAVTLEFMKQ